jgi:hypothetical protein
MPNHFHWVVETRRSPILGIVPKPLESCRFENHGFAVFLGAFSPGLSASASSFFEWMPRAFNAEQVCSGFALTPTKTGRDECDASSEKRGF